MKPLILEIKGNSLDDGPGIRTVVFFKGCPLACQWCHNPESIKSAQEIAFDPARCIDCRTCREVCPEDALSPGNPSYIERHKCNLCLACAEACPSGALSPVGKDLQVSDILEAVLPDKPFFDTSGGGVTLSGGEPALHMDFAGRLLQELKQRRIDTLIETCGHFAFERFSDKLYPFLDAVYFDLKLMNESSHKRYCGVSNNTILANFARLRRLCARDGKVLLPRTPLIPGITDTSSNLLDIASFLQSQGLKKIGLLAFNPLWHDKIPKIGAQRPPLLRDPLRSFQPRDEIQRCNAIFQDAGIEVV